MFTRLALSAALLFAAMLSGCLERLESITIAPDGSATLHSEFRGTPQDFDKKTDALPEAGGAWTVTQREEKDADGKPRTVRTTELTVAPAAPLPSTYAAASDARAVSGLKFPTTLRINSLAGSTYYDLTRTYQRRDEARYAYLKKKLTSGGAFKALEGKDPSTLTVDDREKLLRTFARLEADKYARFIESGAAALESDHTWPQEVSLKLQQAAIDYAQRVDVSKAAALLAQPESPERDASLQSMSTAFTEGMHTAIKAALDTFALPEDQAKRFIDAALAERASRLATEDLADERWEVRVTMPGKVIAHNADRAEGNTLIWEFTADAIMDRDQAVKATSVVEAKK
jgi:hypothetical protein